MHGRRRIADYRPDNSSCDEVTDDDELLTDPSGRRRTRLAQVARSTTAMLQLEKTRVPGTATRQMMVERASPATVKAVNDLIGEEIVLYGNDRAVANSIYSSMGESALPAPAVTVAISSVEQACVASASKVSTYAGSTVAVVDSGEQQVVKAVADVMNAMSTVVSNVAQAQAMLKRGRCQHVRPCLDQTQK
jgi:hypothetical protein